jgi:hypothetical protein
LLPSLRGAAKLRRPVVNAGRENEKPVNDAGEHRGDNPGTSRTQDNPGACAEGVTRDELVAEMNHLQEVMDLRREQDRTLIQLFDKSLSGLGERFDERLGDLNDRLDRMEAALTEIGKTCKLREGELSGYTQLLDRVVARVETNEQKIGELKEGYASLKAWILIVGGITGIASAIAIIFK